MPSLFTPASTKTNLSPKLTNGEKISIYYHNIFDYPLDFADLIKWKVGEGVEIKNLKFRIQLKNGFYFVDGKDATVYKRKLNKRISQRKLVIAKRVANILSYLPSIKMVGITGSLAMENSNEESDIDLMIITSSSSLWTTRLFTYSLIRLFGIQTRHPLDKIQNDRLCLNMWLDESDLVWDKKDRNLYTAHEIAQIVPLVNKNRTYEKFLSKNKWILAFWPGSVKIENWRMEIKNSEETNFIEKIAFKLQYSYMKSKISREVVTKTRALFHPQDWGKVVMQRLAS